MPRQLPPHEASIVPATPGLTECQTCPAMAALKGALDELADIERQACEVLPRLPWEIARDPGIADLALPAYRRVLAAVGLLVGEVHRAWRMQRESETKATTAVDRADRLGARVQQLETLIQQSTERALALVRAGSVEQLAALRATIAENREAHDAFDRCGVPTHDTNGRPLRLAERLHRMRDGVPVEVTFTVNGEEARRR